MKNIAACSDVNYNWLYHYAMKSYFPAWKNVIFQIIFQQEPYPWKEWALNKYGKNGVKQQFPQGKYKSQKSKFDDIIHFIDAHYGNKGYEIISYYFIEEGKLKSPEDSFQSYLKFCYNFLNHSEAWFSLEQIEEMNQIF